MFKISDLKNPPKVPQTQFELRALEIHELTRIEIILKELFKLTPAEARELRNFLFRVNAIWKESGTKFCVQYLSESLRLVMVFLSGKGLNPGPVMRISCYPCGIPRIVGPKMRDAFVNFRNFNNGSDKILFAKTLIFIRLTTTMLSIFRAMNFFSITNFSSVLEEGTGTDLTSIEIRDALKDLKLNKLSLKSPKILWMTSSGVNAKFGWLSLGLDFLALMLNPRVLWSQIVFSFKCGFYFHIVRLLVLSILFLPLLPFAVYLENN